MKRFSLLIGLVALGSSLFAQTTLRVGGNNAPPYRILGSGAPKGIYIDIMNAVADEIKVKLEYVEMPLSRALQEVQQGSIDIMLGPNMTTEREAFMDFITEAPFPRENKVFFGLAKSPTVSSYADLSGRKIGVVKGAVYDSAFDADARLAKEALEDYTTGFRMLARGRIDLVIIPEQQGDFLLKQMASELNAQIVKSSLAFPGKDSYIAIGKKSAGGQALKAQIAGAMVKLKANGTIDRIIASYRQ